MSYDPSYSEPDKVLTYADWRDAYDYVQSASNLCGVAQSYAKVCLKVMDEARARGLGTDWVNRHPMVTLYLDKMLDLNRRPDALDAFSLAHKKLEGGAKL